MTPRSRRRGLHWAVTAAVLVGAVAACGDHDSTGGTLRTGPAVAPQPNASVSSSSSSSSSANPPGSITLAFAGDVHFEGHVRRLLETPDTALRALTTTLGAADFAMVNLETAITSRGNRVPKAYTFRAPSSALDAVASAGVDAVSLANNHGVDYGAVGLRDTLAAKQSGRLPMVGIGASATEAFTPLVADVGGVRVAILASLQLFEETTAQWSATASQGGVATNLDMTRLRAAVRGAAASADLVVVFMHWGTDYASCADAWQRRTAAALEREGADLIVGGHAHRPQGSGWLGRSFVAYGLGNFVWWKSQEPDSRSGVLTVRVDAAAARARGAATGSARRTPSPLVTSASWTPMLIGHDGVPAIPRDDGALTRLQRGWATASQCADLRQRP